MKSVVNNSHPLSMPEIQKVSFNILKFISDICEKNNFKYCLMYGTLLGAIRHNGYIPWDDDVDIMMPREDYEKFLNYASIHKEDFLNYRIYNRSTHKDFIYAITRVCDIRYEIKAEDKYSCGMGIFIDIYPYDGLGDTKEIALKKLKHTRKYCDSIFTISQKWTGIPKVLNIKGKIGFLYHQLSKRIRGFNYYHRKLNNLKEFSFETSEYVGPLMWYFQDPESVLFKREDFNNLIKHQFENNEFYIPKEYDKILTQLYGDYMTPPPVEKQINHHQYKAYRK